MREEVAITRKEECEDRKVEEACKRIRSADWPQSAKVAAADKIAKYPGGGNCKIEWRPASRLTLRDG